jgi:hypothetical protein
VKKIEFKFFEVLHECILDGLESVLGKSCTRAIVFHIELGDYIDDAGEFHRNLYALLGLGALVLEKVIVKELFRRLDIPYEERGNFDFAGCVNEARELFLKKQKVALNGLQH